MKGRHYILNSSVWQKVTRDADSLAVGPVAQPGSCFAAVFVSQLWFCFCLGSSSSSRLFITFCFIWGAFSFTFSRRILWNERLEGIAERNSVGNFSCCLRRLVRWRRLISELRCLLVGTLAISSCIGWHDGRHKGLCLETGSDDCGRTLSGWDGGEEGLGVVLVLCFASVFHEIDEPRNFQNWANLSEVLPCQGITPVDNF